MATRRRSKILTFGDVADYLHRKMEDQIHAELQSNYKALYSIVESVAQRWIEKNDSRMCGRCLQSIRPHIQDFHDPVLCDECVRTVVSQYRDKV